MSFAALLVLTCVRLLSWPPDFLEQQLAFSVEDAEQQEVDRRIAPALSQLRTQWNAPRRALPPVYHCGAREGYFPAYVWEEFVGLDVGEARGDWVVAAGAEANRSRYVTVEANPILFQLLLQDLAANSGLADRVLAYNAAVKSDSLFYGHYKNHSSSWNTADDPVMSNTNWTGGAIGMVVALSVMTMKRTWWK